ncbi:MAG TPA: hypothetical protein ENN91_06860 [Firmicutes bacterium]|nr:hypothetical protein [Bacillota bacterium]
MVYYTETYLQTGMINMRNDRGLRREFAKKGMYNPASEHDACGIGFLVNINGEKNSEIIGQGVKVLKNLLHRGATGADDQTGDGAGLLFQLPDQFFRRLAEEQGVRLPSAGS